MAPARMRPSLARSSAGPGAGSDAVPAHHRARDLIEGVRSSGRAIGRERLRRLRVKGLIAIQAGVAAVLAWFAAHEVLRTPQPVFAPVTAVAVVAAAVGWHLRHTAERIVGVLIGVGIGELLILLIGTGPWQTGVIVTLAIYAALFIKGGNQILVQAGGTAVLLASLHPSNPHLGIPRFLNAVVGGVVGLGVTVLLLPLNPLRAVDRAGGPLLAVFAEQLATTARALADRDPGRVQHALDRIRKLTSDLRRLREAMEGAREAVTLAPARWRRRQALAQYAIGARHLERALGNSRPLMRRSVTLLNDHEPVPQILPAAVAQLAEAVRLLRVTLHSDRDPQRVRELALRAAGAAGRAYDEGVGFSGSVVVAQVRTIATDLLRATDLDQPDAVRMVRKAVATKTRTRRSMPSGR